MAFFPKEPTNSGVARAHAQVDRPTWIEVWKDTVSEPGSPPVWCVSLCDADGEVRCLSWHDTREEAEADAARRRRSTIGQQP